MFEQREEPAEGWSEFKLHCRGAGLDERGGAEDEQRSANHVAGCSEWMVSSKHLSASFVLKKPNQEGKVCDGVFSCLQCVRALVCGPVEEVSPLY